MAWMGLMDAGTATELYVNPRRGNQRLFHLAGRYLMAGVVGIELYLDPRPDDQKMSHSAGLKSLIGVGQRDVRVAQHVLKSGSDICS